MAIIRWNRSEAPSWAPLEQLSRLRDEMDRLFATPSTELRRGGQFFNQWAPAFDLYEDKDNVFVKTDIPGMKKEDIEISLHENALTIAGERKMEQKQEQAENYRSERFFGRFSRSLVLPVDVESDKVKASYKDGILMITLPKAEQAKPKHIEVSVK